jgi:hypothetical protein
MAWSSEDPGCRVMRRDECSWAAAVHNIGQKTEFCARHVLGFRVTEGALLYVVPLHNSKVGTRVLEALSRRNTRSLCLETCSLTVLIPGS